MHRTKLSFLNFSALAARRLYGIADIAETLRLIFPNDTALKKHAAQWIRNGFDGENPLYRLFAADYGLDKSGKSTKNAVSLLSKYLYFATGYAFPIYDALGAKHHFIAGKKTAGNFQKRFRILKEIMEENSIDGFDQLDCLFWLYGKVRTVSFSTVLNKTHYSALTEYAGKKSLAAVIAEIRAGKNTAALQKVFGVPLYEFIQKTGALEKEYTYGII